MTSGRAGDSQGGASYKRPLGVSFLHTFLHEQKSMAAGGMTNQDNLHSAGGMTSYVNRQSAGGSNYLSSPPPRDAPAWG